MKKIESARRRRRGASAEVRAHYVRGGWGGRSACEIARAGFGSARRGGRGRTEHEPQLVLAVEPAGSAAAVAATHRERSRARIARARGRSARYVFFCVVIFDVRRGVRSRSESPYSTRVLYTYCNHLTAPASRYKIRFKYFCLSTPTKRRVQRPRQSRSVRVLALVPPPPTASLVPPLPELQLRVRDVRVDELGVPPPLARRHFSIAAAAAV